MDNDLERCQFTWCPPHYEARSPNETGASPGRPSAPTRGARRPRPGGAAAGGCAALAARGLSTTPASWATTCSLPDAHTPGPRGAVSRRAGPGTLPGGSPRRPRLPLPPVPSGRPGAAGQSADAPLASRSLQPCPRRRSASPGLI